MSRTQRHTLWGERFVFALLFVFFAAALLPVQVIGEAHMAIAAQAASPTPPARDDLP